MFFYVACHNWLLFWIEIVYYQQYWTSSGNSGISEKDAIRQVNKVNLIVCIIQLLYPKY